MIGALWRLGYLFAVKIDDDLLLNDSLYYSIQAGRNSQGAWFRDGLTELPGAEHGPLTSLYLTPWSLVGDDIVAWQRFAMTLIGIATVAVVGLVGCRLAGPRAGLVAAAIAAVYPNLWINDSLVMSESLACLIVAVALLVALGFDREPGLGRAAALGVVVGLGALTRSEIALYAAGFAVLAWWRGAGHRRRALLPVIVLSAAVLTVMPWAVYNVARFDRPVLLSTNDGGTLIGSNCDSTYYGDVGGWDIGCLTPVAVDGAEPVDAVGAIDRVARQRHRLCPEPHVPGPDRGRRSARADRGPLRSWLPRQVGPWRGEGRLGGVGRHRRVVGPGRHRGRRVGGARSARRRVARAIAGPVVAGRTRRRRIGDDDCLLRIPSHPGTGRAGRGGARRGRRGCAVEQATRSVVMLSGAAVIR